MSIGLTPIATSPSGVLHIAQEAPGGNIPPLYLTQDDVDQDFFEFDTTIGAGNAIEAVGSKFLTITHFVKSTIPGALTRHFPVGTIGTGAPPPILYTATRITNADSPYAVLSTDEIIFADTDGGAITVNLPAGIDGTHYRITNTGSSANDVTVDPNGAEQLFNNGAGVAFTLVDSETINIYFETTENWW